MTRRTWYFIEPKTKLHEFYNLLHLPYTFMCLSFLASGFFLSKEVNWIIFTGALVAYFFGLGIGAHSLDQTSKTGSRYVKLLTRKELLIIGSLSLIIAILLGIYATIVFNLYLLPLLIIIQGIFAVAYPIGELFKGYLHNDTSFAIGFGFLPPVIGYYANTSEISIAVIVLALFCFTISYIEILLSRYVRRVRKEIGKGILEFGDEVYISVNKLNIKFIQKRFLERPEKALEALCILSYLLPILLLLR